MWRLRGKLKGSGMRAGLTFALLALVGLGTVSCSSGAQQAVAPQPVKPIDASRFFTGRWYEIGRTPMSLTKNCVAGTTDYFNNASGKLIDLDACRMGTPAGAEKDYQGPVTILNPGQNNKVTVQYTVYYIIPVTKTYWMLDHGADYSWFIVTDPAFDMLSLFTRNPRPSTAEVAALTARASALGYDAGELEYPEQFPPGQH